MMESCVLLFSGGLDSSVCLHHLLAKKFDVIPLFIDYGQVNGYYEHLAAEAVVSRAREVFDLPDLELDMMKMDMVGSPMVGDQPEWMDIDAISDGETVQIDPVYVPGRNTIFVMMALQVAFKYEIDTIALGIKEDNSQLYPDCSVEWFVAMQHVLDLHHLGKQTHVKLIAPLIEHNRKAVRELAEELKVDRSITLSCFVPLNGKPCGKCTGCLEDEDA